MGQHQAKGASNAHALAAALKGNSGPGRAACFEGPPYGPRGDRWCGRRQHRRRGPKQYQRCRHDAGRLAGQQVIQQLTGGRAGVVAPSPVVMRVVIGGCRRGQPSSRGRPVDVADGMRKRNPLCAQQCQQHHADEAARGLKVAGQVHRRRIHPRCGRAAISGGALGAGREDTRSPAGSPGCARRSAIGLPQNCRSPVPEFCRWATSSRPSQ